MTSLATTPTSPATDGHRFRVRREPRLHAAMLGPLGSGRPLPVPVPGRPAFHLFWARNGLYHGLGILGLAPGDTVLVPAFHCASLVEPLLRFGASVRFYEVGADGSADLDDIRARIDGRTRALLGIHYFGFPQSIVELRALCDRHGMFLIEDCAHVLTGQVVGRPLGSFGDVSIFSWRKFLPLYDGGVLVVNNPALASPLRLEDPSRLLRLRIWKNVLDRLVQDSTALPAGAILARLLTAVSHLSRRVASRGGGEPASLAVNNYSLDFEPQSLGLRMSPASRRILRHADFGAIVEARRRNYRALEERLAAVADVTSLFKELPDGVGPWVLPVVAKSHPGFHRALRARGIPAVTWDEVVHRDLILDDFPTARHLYDHAIFLPVHQSLSESEIDLIARVVREAAGSS